MLDERRVSGSGAKAINGRTFQDALCGNSRLLDTPPQTDSPGLHIFITMEIHAIDTTSDGDLFVIFAFAPIFIIIPAIKRILTDVVIAWAGEFVIIAIGILVSWPCAISRKRAVRKISLTIARILLPSC